VELNIRDIVILEITYLITTKEILPCKHKIIKFTKQMYNLYLYC